MGVATSTDTVYVGFLVRGFLSVTKGLRKGDLGCVWVAKAKAGQVGWVARATCVTGGGLSSLVCWDLNW